MTTIYAVEKDYEYDGIETVGLFLHEETAKKYRDAQYPDSDVVPQEIIDLRPDDLVQTPVYLYVVTVNQPGYVNPYTKGTGEDQVKWLTDREMRRWPWDPKPNERLLRMRRGSIKKNNRMVHISLATSDPERRTEVVDMVEKAVENFVWSWNHPINPRQES